MLRRLVLPAALLLTSPLTAQPRWKEVGKTGDANPVFVDQRSVKHVGDKIDATIRVRFLKPKKMPGGDVTSSRTTIILDCKAKSIAIKENVYYYDEKTNKVFQRTVAQVPGFAPVMGGSMTQVAYDALCK